MQRTMKSKDARANWSKLLRDTENGHVTVIEHYDRPVAKIVPYRTLRAVAYTFNSGTWATVAIVGLRMDEAPEYPDHRPSAHGRLDGAIWELTDQGDGRDLVVIGASLAEAIRSWAGQLGYQLDDVTIDPEHEVDPDADW